MKISVKVSEGHFFWRRCSGDLSQNGFRRLVTRKMVLENFSQANFSQAKWFDYRAVITGKMILEALSQKKWF